MIIERPTLKLPSFLGMIHRREGRNEEARQDFEKASEMGSNFAKSALTAMNPYAAMCNQMLKNVFQVGQLSLTKIAQLRISSVKISKFEILMDVEEDEASFHA